MIKPILLCAVQLALALGVQAQPTAQTGREATMLSGPLSPALTTLGPVEIEYLDALGGNMVQDPHGFMWFGGGRRLVRYDGYGFDQYTHDPQDSTSLPYNRVESLYVDSDGTLWVGTFGSGLARFDAATETFTRFRRDPDDPTSLSQDTVTVLLEDSRGVLWVGTHGGLNRFDRETGTFTHYRHDPDDPTSLSCDQVRALYEDRQGTLWVGTGSPPPTETPVGEGGLNRLDREMGTPGSSPGQAFTRYLHDPEDETSLINNKVMSLYEDSRGVFYVGTLGDGLHTMDRKAGTFTRHRYDPSDPTKLSRPFLAGTSQVDEGCEGFICGGVTFIHEDQQGLLWIGGIGGGVNRYNVETGAMSHYEAATSGLVGNTIWTMAESHDGTLWISTLIGMHKVIAAANAFPHVKPDPADPNSLGGSIVQAFHEDHDGMLWIATRSGLDRLDREAGVFTHFRHDPDDASSLRSNAVSSLHEARDGTLWVGSWNGGIDRYDRGSGRFTRFQPDPDDPTSLSNSSVWDLLVDGQGRFWVGTWGSGLDRLDLATGIATHHRYDPDDPTSLSDNTVYVTYEDGAGVLWVGTGNGLNRLVEGPEAAFTAYLSDRAVTSIHEDEAGRFWVGTWGDGLHLFDRETGRSTRYGPEEGLPSANVASLLEDDGNLWISTTEAGFLSPVQGRLSRLDPETATFTNFDPQDGLPEIGFFLGSALKSRDGTLFFGGNGGFTAFDPATIREPERRPPKMALTGLRVFNDEVAPAPGAPLEQAIHLAEEIRLPYSQNDFTIDYAALAFRDPEEIQYHYQLEGHDAGWVSARTQRSTRYAGLAPGSYVFRVRAIDSRGLRSEESASIRVEVLPPWWRTWWAYTLYGLLFALGVFAVDRVQRRRLIRRERERAREEALERERAHAHAIEAANARLRANEQQLEQQNVQLAEQARRLAELDQLKSRFFANISHEFRTPLTLILGPVQDALAGRYGALGDRLRAQLALMRQSADRLLGLIGQLLDLSKLDAGSMPLQARRTDLVPRLRRLVQSFAARAEHEQITLQFEARPKTIELYIDRDKLEKVVVNLLSNAFKFTPAGGKIRLEVAAIQHDGEAVVEITVRDTGQGIAAEEVPYIFDRFYQADASATRRHEGTGIGLALVKELVERHGGQITVESTVGFGTTFTVRLPQGRAHLRPEDLVEDTDAEAVEDIPTVANPPAGDGFPEAAGMDKDTAALEEATEAVEPEADEEKADRPVVLVVEDHADVRAYLRSHLAERYAVIEAADGAEGLAQAREHAPALIIADVMMPEMDGFALCRSIKTDEALRHLPVLLLTARADEESRLEGLETGADAYLTKPFNAEELLIRAENLIEVRCLLRRQFSEEVVIGPHEVVAPSQEAVFVERVRAVVEEHLGEPSFTVEWLAQEVGVSTRHLHRKMPELTELTPAGYVRMMRLERAAQLLQQDAGTVSEVAYAVGFQDASYFSRVFKQAFGVTPSAFAAEHE